MSKYTGPQRIETQGQENVLAEPELSPQEQLNKKISEFNDLLLQRGERIILQDLDAHAMVGKREKVSLRFAEQGIDHMKVFNNFLETFHFYERYFKAGISFTGRKSVNGKIVYKIDYTSDRDSEKCTKGLGYLIADPLNGTYEFSLENAEIKEFELRMLHSLVKNLPKEAVLCATKPVVESEGPPNLHLYFLAKKLAEQGCKLEFPKKKPTSWDESIVSGSLRKELIEHMKQTDPKLEAKNCLFWKGSDTEQKYTFASVASEDLKVPLITVPLEQLTSAAKVESMLQMASEIPSAILMLDFNQGFDVKGWTGWLTIWEIHKVFVKYLKDTTGPSKAHVVIFLCTDALPSGLTPFVTKTWEFNVLDEKGRKSLFQKHASHLSEESCQILSSSTAKWNAKEIGEFCDFVKVHWEERYTGDEKTKVEPPFKVYNNLLQEKEKVNVTAKAKAKC